MEVDGEGFEDIIFEGLLEYIFYYLYSLPLSTHSFNSVLVNKRWSKFFAHPLQIFASGSFKPQLSIFPPSYYVSPSHGYGYGAIADRTWCKIKSSQFMSKQIQNCESGDVEREDFILNEVFVHHIFGSIILTIPSLRIEEAVNRLLKNSTYRPAFLQSSAHLTDICAMKWIKLHKHIFKRGEKPLVTNIINGNRVLGLYAIQEADLRLSDVDYHIIDEEMSLAAVKKHGSNLYHVPNKLRTDEMCLLAVADDAGVLSLVPRHLRTQDMYKAHLIKHPDAIEYIRKDMLNEELVKTAMDNGGHLLGRVPEHFRTMEVCKIAVRNDHQRALKYVPRKIREEVLSDFRARKGKEGLSKSGRRRRNKKNKTVGLLSNNNNNPN